MITGFGIMAVGFIADHFATVYALAYSTRATYVYVGDLLLDNLPIINLNPIIVEGALWTIFLSVILVLYNPRKILFTLKAVGLFIIIRAFFISLTHVGIYPGQINPGPGFFDALYSYFNLQTGYFFSGHTALPFLMALIFWENRLWRYIYLALSVIFGASVLLAHVHYSIDVFAAPFMSYGIFEISRKLFPEDYKLLVPKAAP
jgi:membrane-associated phospholipid phosphatase